MPSSFDLGPAPYLGYTGSLLDRAAELRGDLAAQSAFDRDPCARTLLVAGEFICLNKGDPWHDPWFTLAQAAVLASAPDITRAEPHEQLPRVFLGHHDGEARFALAMAPAAAEALKDRQDLIITDLRSAAMRGAVAQQHLPAFAQAKSLIGWHGRHRFCSNCGTPTRIMQAGWRRDCPGCGMQHFPRTDPVVIMLVANGDHCLLGRQPRFGKGMWSCLAGFVEPGETIEEAVRRETLEEAGIRCGPVAYFASQPWPFPMSLMIGCHARAVTTEIKVDRSELEDARWFPRAEVAAMLMHRHPDGLTATHPYAIAHHLIRAWLEAGAAMFP
ncbi:MAG: NAD(+) diphosphatase [Bradyrhizobiaceae bacterium]|nr:NAD(+) diphosphatase [Bradyrhizobiaceae bacterium]